MNHTGVASTGSRRHARKNLSFTGSISEEAANQALDAS
jgi:hypothetical protein